MSSHQTDGRTFCRNRRHQTRTTAGGCVEGSSENDLTHRNTDGLEHVAVPEEQVAGQRIKEELTNVVSGRLRFADLGNRVVGQLFASDGVAADAGNIKRAAGQQCGAVVR